MAKIVVDPVTRIEGRLRIEAEVSNGRISDAWSSSTMFRGIETILKNRDPREAWYITQRFCGVCTTVHSIASIRAVENALKIKIPPNAELIRNIIIGIQNVQDHVIQFYHLHALDWVDITSAVKADPVKTAALAASVSDWPINSPTYFKTVQDKLRAFMSRGRLGLFANAYWGHPAYRLPPEADLMATAHYLEALEWQKDVIKIHAILGSKNPHPQTFLVGGMAIPIDPDSQNALNDDKLIVNKDLVHVLPVDQKKIAEYVDHSWYEYSGGAGKGLHPSEGETAAKYTGPKPPFQYLDTNGKYSWVKSPRYQDQPMEVGPLARMLVAYASGHKEVKETVDGVLTKLGVGPEALFSTLGRTAARGVDALLIARETPRWLDQLRDNISKGDYATTNNEKWDPATWPEQASGYGWHEAPRGALGHWITIRNRKIHNYQAVVPTTWNASPRDAKGARGPYEAALVGTPMADPNKPLEILRTIHSFDPCLACAVHVFDPEGREMVKVDVM